MATFTKINDWVEKGFAEGGINLSSNAITIALTNTAPGSEASPPTSDGNGILANLTQVAYTNLSSRVPTISSSSQTGGTYSLVLTDLVMTSSGGTTGALRYVYHYDDTIAGDPLIQYYDYGSSITLADGETLTVDYGANFFTLA